MRELAFLKPKSWRREIRYWAVFLTVLAISIVAPRLFG